MTDSEGSKQPRVDQNRQPEAPIDEGHADSSSINTAMLLAALPQAIRDDGVAEREEMSSLEQKVVRKIASAAHEWGGQFQTIPANVDRSIGARDDRHASRDGNSGGILLK